MNLEEIQLLNKLEKYESDKEILKWLGKVLSSCVNESSSRAIISDLIGILDNRDVDRYEETSPYYNMLLAYSYATSGIIASAIKEADLSVSGFKKLGKEKDWQQAISSWFLGLLLCDQEHYDSAEVKLDDAIKIISELASEQHRLGIYGEQDYLKSVIGEIEINRGRVEELKASTPKEYIAPLPSQSRQKNKAEKNNNRSPSPTIAHSNQIKKQKRKLQLSLQRKRKTRFSQQNSKADGYLSMSWMPVFESVSAGPNGIVVMDAPSNAELTFSAIEIHGVPHNIYLIKNVDRQITLNHAPAYGLVLVEGNSMNNLQPVNINNGDYALFSKQQSPEENDIVIASRKTSSGDFVYTIKRYKKKEELLISDSSDQDNSNEYLPIKFSQNYQILGVVIAVAKQTRNIRR
jgi:SOS-response transcriptional repressor LexA